MVSRKYASALALSTLLGCSVPPRSSDYIESPVPTALEERVMNSYIDSLNKTDEIDNYNPFWHKRVSLMYSTKSGPGVPVRPTDPKLVGEVMDQLNSLGAYVLPVGVFSRDYAGDIRISRHPKLSPADIVVIADNDPGKISEDLKNVYLLQKDGNKYKIVEANKQ